MTQRGGGGYAGLESFQDTVRYSAENYTRQKWANQPNRVEVWVEAAGMVPQVARAVAGTGALIFSSGGFNSTTMKHDAAQRFRQRWIRSNQRTVLLHVGDHDPSGVAIYDNLVIDLRAFLWDIGADPDRMLEMERIAVTEQQAIELDLPSAPPKRSDSRSNYWTGETWQAEALPPSTLADIIFDATIAHIDGDELGRLEEIERDERAQLLEWVEGLG